MKKAKKYVIDSRGVRVPANENEKDCPGCKVVGPAPEKHKDFPSAIAAVHGALDSMQNFLHEGREVPSAEVVAALIDRFDQLGEKLWLKTPDENESLMLETPISTSSTDLETTNLDAE